MSRPVVTDRAKLSPLPSEKSVRPSTADQHATVDPPPVQKQEKGVARTTVNRPAVSLEVYPIKPGSGLAGAVAHLPTDPPGREVSTVSKESKPDASQRSSAEDKTPGPGDRRPDARSAAAPIATAQARTNMAFGVDSPGSSVSIKFRPDVKTPEMLAFLKHYKLTIADGPSPEGSYRIRLSAVQLPKALVDEFVRSMRAQTKIVLDVKE